MLIYQPLYYHNKIMKIITCLLLLSLPGFSLSAEQKGPKTLRKNKMKVQWEHRGDRVYFEMEAPTDGWVCIGFNDSDQISGAYLLMGHVLRGKAEVTEHYTQSPGNYLPVRDLGMQTAISDCEGFESGQFTRMSFSLPVLSPHKYGRDLKEGQAYTLILAYSREDDFQHHSMMRTSIHIQL